MHFLDNLLAGGSGYAIEHDGSVITFRSANDGKLGLEAFQDFADIVRRNNGRGYMVWESHLSDKYPGALLDAISIKRL